MGGAHGTTHHLLAPQLNRSWGHGVQGRLDPLHRGAGVNQGTQQHVAGNSGGGIDPERGHEVSLDSSDEAVTRQ